MEVVAPDLKYSLGTEIRLRTRFHAESGSELLVLLSPYGLDVEHVNTVQGGELGGRMRSESWINTQQRQEFAERQQQLRQAPNPQQPHLDTTEEIED
jgi:hypothetical protein